VNKKKENDSVYQARTLQLFNHYLEWTIHKIFGYQTLAALGAAILFRKKIRKFIRDNPKTLLTIGCIVSLVIAVLISYFRVDYVAFPSKHCYDEKEEWVKQFF